MFLNHFYEVDSCIVLKNIRNKEKVAGGFNIIGHLFQGHGLCTFFSQCSPPKSSHPLKNTIAIRSFFQNSTKNLNQHVVSQKGKEC
jgi:hypothetical protein